MGYAVSHVRIRAPRERCFGLARSIDFTLASGEARAVEGVTSGLRTLGGTTVWVEPLLGLPTRMRLEVTLVDPPWVVFEEQREGPFERYQISRWFYEDQAENDETHMESVVEFTLPEGSLPRETEQKLLEGYLQERLRREAERLKHAAETDAWRAYVPDAPERT